MEYLGSVEVRHCASMPWLPQQIAEPQTLLRADLLNPLSSSSPCAAGPLQPVRPSGTVLPALIQHLRLTVPGVECVSGLGACPDTVPCGCVCCHDILCNPWSSPWLRETGQGHRPLSSRVPSPSLLPLSRMCRDTELSPRPSSSGQCAMETWHVFSWSLRLPPLTLLAQMYHVNVSEVIDMVGQKAESLSTRGQLRIMEFVRKYMVRGGGG